MISCLFQCDGCSLDLAHGPSLMGIAVLNIPSIYGGTNLWGDNPSAKVCVYICVCVCQCVYFYVCVCVCAFMHVCKFFFCVCLLCPYQLLKQNAMCCKFISLLVFPDTYLPSIYTVASYQTFIICNLLYGYSQLSLFLKNEHLDRQYSMFFYYDAFYNILNQVLHQLQVPTKKSKK